MMLRRLSALPILLAVTASMAVAAPKTAPRISVASFDALPQPLPLPYHAGSGRADVAAARARAIRAHKRLLIDLGGNWCLDCRLLAGVMDLPQLRGFVARNFEVVTVDIGRFDQNLDVPASYGLKGRLAGVPALLIVDPKTNRLVNRGHETALADARSLTPQALADRLAGWTT